MTMIEVAIALPVVLVALGMFVQMFNVGSGLRDTGRETWMASSIAQDTLELLRNEPFELAVAMYNADPFDDPNGPGTAPGNTFPIAGLDPLEGEAAVGEVVLPIVNTGTEVVPVFEVREDMQLPELGLPRDLNGDAVIDSLDHTGDYTLLPVLVRVRWDSASGPREFEVRTILTEVRF